MLEYASLLMHIVYALYCITHRINALSNHRQLSIWWE